MPRINLNIEESKWESEVQFNDWIETLEKIFFQTIKKVYSGPKSLEVNLLLTDNNNIKDLNNKFRGNNVETNVLSFPQFEPEDICKIDTLLLEEGVFLGDIAMSYDKIMQESKEFSFRFFDRATHLFVHAVLHLFGLDHIEHIGREKMESLEIDILKDFGMNNPYVIYGEEAAL